MPEWAKPVVFECTIKAHDYLGSFSTAIMKSDIPRYTEIPWPYNPNASEHVQLCYFVTWFHPSLFYDLFMNEHNNRTSLKLDRGWLVFSCRLMITSLCFDHNGLKRLIMENNGKAHALNLYQTTSSWLFPLIQSHIDEIYSLRKSFFFFFFQEA